MSDTWTQPPDAPRAPIWIPTESGGQRLSDEEYNRRWFERLMKRTTYNDKGCFIWTGPRMVKGYIMHCHRAFRASGHRIVYMLIHGVRLAKEEQVCHSCDERRCWNPAHLFVGSNQDNAKDMAAKKRHHLNRKTHCKHGHEFTPENTYEHTDKHGHKHRTCITCDRERQMRDYRTKPEVRAKRAEQKRRRLARLRSAEPQPEKSP